MKPFKLSRRAARPPKKPVDVISTKFAAATLALAADFLETDAFKHALTKGEQRETPVQAFIRNNLPRGFDVAAGEVIDPWGSRSTQLDVMVFDRIRNVPVYDKGAAILPAEALLASVEVKSLLNKSEIEKSFRAAQTLKALRPFKRPLIDGDRGEDSRKDQCRYFHVVFAYDSDLSEKDWLQSEFGRIDEAAVKTKVKVDAIDRVYVARRGLIHPSSKRGVVESATDGLGLMNLFAHLLNFVVRENGNRAPARYDQYFGRLAAGWTKLV